MRVEQHHTVQADLRMSHLGRMLFEIKKYVFSWEIRRLHPHHIYSEPTEQQRKCYFIPPAIRKKKIQT